MKCKAKIINTFSFFIALLSSSVELYGEINNNTFVEYQRNRDASISSYRINFKQIYHRFDISDFEKEYNGIQSIIADIRKLEKKAEAIDYDAWITERFHNWETEKNKWVNIEFIQRGDNFLEKRSNPDGSVRKTHYDGKLYSCYQPVNDQLDIRPEPVGINSQLNVLDDLGITSGTLWNKSDKFSFLQQNGITQITCPLNNDNSLIVTFKGNAKRELYHTSQIGNIFEKHYFINKNIEGYDIPHIIMNIQKGPEGGSVFLYVVNSIQINGDIEDEELALGEIPPWTTVVDYRQRPPAISRYMQGPRHVMTDEFVLGVLDEKTEDSSEAQSHTVTDSANDIYQKENEENISTKDLVLNQEEQSETLPEENSNINTKEHRFSWMIIVIIAAISVVFLLYVWRQINKRHSQQ